MIKKILKTFLFIILFTIGALLLFVLVSVLPIDRYDYHKSSFYQTMNDRLDSLKKVKSVTKGSTFLVGYSKVNLTPDHRISLAGYGNRKGALYSTVHDSIFVRAIVVSNKHTRVAIVSADLLIIPPTVTAVLEKELPSIGFSLNNTYLNAVHSHNSIGNWGKGAVGFMYGSYQDSIVHFIADKIKESILLASKNALPATIKT
ncbi:MAG TPA: neutral/alkaline non-lysosomal ceramidase N-terminal domain-containing protein, partial [Cyclobacteriaceae bacterium]|nr:neutral/alkaline non-lysosomal ceramidase N-terminal domain-containing protein [Cyclobacteriaceae bacterium]